MNKWYRDRIGTATTDDEVRGYWIFAVGLLGGLVGILMFLSSTAGSALREWSIVFAAAGLAMVFAGSIIRLPLQKSATALVYIGLAICGLTLAWFVTAFPAQWSPQTGQPQIIGMYAVGLLVMGIGGVAVPLLYT